jgi:hypothetical protein
LSIQALSQAFGFDLHPLPKFVLVVLADSANEFGLAWPSVAHISKNTGISRRGVQRWLRHLESVGAIEPVKDAGRFGTTTYRLNFAVLKPAPRQNAARECPKDLRRLVIAAFGGVCQYCNQPGENGLGPDGQKWHVDRVVPGSRGGAYEPGNVTLACAFCNVSKKAKDVSVRPRCLSDIPGAIHGTRFDDASGAIRGTPGGATSVARGCHRKHDPVPRVAPNPSLIPHEPKSVDNDVSEAGKRAREEIRKLAQKMRLSPQPLKRRN